MARQREEATRNPPSSAGQSRSSTRKAPTALEAERHRLAEAREKLAPWYRWGPYLAERQWGTVREDYSANGAAWDSFPHDHARSRAYRWGEDGLLGICDDRGRLCFALALWNGSDPIVKERLFGLTGLEGNHGEDVKEYYFFLDSTPTHSYMRGLYKYPQRPFPYTAFVAENRRRGRQDPEFELIDTGVFNENRYFDVTVEYAKAGPEDVMIRIAATNRGPDRAPIHLLPTLWFRNTWAWGRDDRRPELRVEAGESSPGRGGALRLIRAAHHELGEYWLACEGTPALLFTENETNFHRLWNVPNRTPYVKDGINDAVVAGAVGAVNPRGLGTKAAAHYTFTVAPGETRAVLLRLSKGRAQAPFANAADALATRQAEADAFFSAFSPEEMAGVPSSGRMRCSRPIRTGATTCLSTSISTGTPGPGWGRVTKPGGRRWWPNCSSRPGDDSR